MEIPFSWIIGVWLVLELLKSIATILVGLISMRHIWDQSEARLICLYSCLMENFGLWFLAANIVSPVKSAMFVWAMTGMSLVYIRNNVRKSQDPCVTPAWICPMEEVSLLIFVTNVLLIRKDWIILIKLIEIYMWFILKRRPSCHTRLNAFSISRNIAAVCSFWLILTLIWSNKSVSWRVIECSSLVSNYSFLILFKRLFFRCCSIMRS